MQAGNSSTHVPLPPASQFNVPPTSYVNQMAVNQHMGTQPTPIPPTPQIYRHQQRHLHHRCQVAFSCSGFPLLMRHQHPLKIILSTLQIHHHRVTQGQRVQIGKVLSRCHQHSLPPLHQKKNQDLFVGTVGKQDI